MGKFESNSYLRVAYPGGKTSVRGPEGRIWLGNFGFFSFWETVLKFSQGRRQVLVEVRRGSGTCEAPCILDHHCSSATL